MVNVAEILDNLSDKNVLVVGDVMLDHYLYGQVQSNKPRSAGPDSESSIRKLSSGRVQQMLRSTLRVWESRHG